MHALEFFAIVTYCGYLVMYYTCDSSNGLVGVLHSVVCGYPQVYRFQDMFQKVGVAFSMPNTCALRNSIPTYGHSARIALPRPATAIN